MSNTTAERDISQAYYDADYFVKGNKQIIDPTSGQIKTWGYQGTDWSGHFHIVSGLNHIFNFEPTSMLDIGAGQGSFVDYASSKTFPVIGPASSFNFCLIGENKCFSAKSVFSS